MIIPGGGAEGARDWRTLFRKLSEAVRQLRALPAVESDSEARRLLVDIATAESLEDLECLTELLQFRLSQIGALETLTKGGGRVRQSSASAGINEAESRQRLILRL
ncbi:MAG: hypothetical protein ACR652_13610 [Methylocystis sp.]|uniref:hypothetical protein n=1 Tax=Methylocystis sp. TaxID=1911079 RepID=UPI003DA5D821